ncbi:PhoD-like phosphatase [Aerosakkonema sp. BLCC-F183]|uniref:PhoD-like phosphatase n=1 Tax=Aerosakkonema sp. BLCC-F183 TaxID=3342834 RepID=UPI0035B956C3
MSWTPLSYRIALLPLILAGPILRRTDPDAVTVWIVLKEASEVTLRVYSTENGKGEIVNDLLLEGSRTTVQLGKYLHVVAVTAKSVNGEYLQPGQIYAYNMDFACRNWYLAKALCSEASFNDVTISYFEHQLPTFAMPPDDLNFLRIVHGSCRKPHGGGRDALNILDNMILEYANQPTYRPHQLFFTGDQIYGDDVADALLWALTEAGDTLLGWQEKLPLKKDANDEQRYTYASDLKPGTRSEIARDYGGFTAMLINKPEKAKSHLFSLGEYLAMYLFVWSPILWPHELPHSKDAQKDGKEAKLWDKEALTVEAFARDLWKIRRSLANIPTYMICDDHDISDDWYLNREWCNRVLSKPLGRRTLQNGLLTYAIFQAWGNTPENFQNGQSGEKLLEAAQQWSLSAGNDDLVGSKIAKYLAIPEIDSETNLPKVTEDEDNFILNRDYADGTQCLEWYYKIESFKHETIVLDTRTWRGYAKGDDRTTEPPMLLSHTAFEKQIQNPLKECRNPNIEATIIIAPTNLISLAIIDSVQKWDLERGNVFGSDAGDSWNFHETAFSMLLAEMFKQRDRIVILSGDIHYGCAVRLSYWSNYHFGESKLDRNLPESSHVLAQLTSSAFKNAEWTTHFIHTKAKSIAPEKPQYWAGWNNTPQLIEIQVIQEKVRAIDVKLPPKKPVLRQIDYIRGSDEIAWEIFVKNRESLPDWRYCIEWIKRQKAQEIVWQNNQELAEDEKSKSWKDFISLLWRNRWLQEGDEVVGYSNFGVVTFQWPENNDNGKAVIQDLYWHPVWKPNSTVFSRYFVPLSFDEAPPPPRVFSE